MKELDKTDLKILKFLQQNARIPMTELAEKVGLSTTPVTERVKRLERDNFITGYHARLNPNLLGKGLLIFVELKLRSKSGNIFEDFSSGSHEDSANFGMPLGIGRIRLSD